MASIKSIGQRLDVSELAGAHLGQKGSKMAAEDPQGPSAPYPCDFRLYWLTATGD